MKKLLLSGTLSALLLPGIALAAAYNAVSIPSGTNVSVNGITINVTGATIAQLDVGATTFSVTLGPASTVRLSAPNLNQMSLSTGGSDFLTASVCDGSGSSMTLTSPSSAATTSVTVTPSTTICTAQTAPAAGTGNNGGVVSGGGGGGGSTIVPTTTTRTTTTTTTKKAATTSTSTLTAEQKQTLIVELTKQLNTLLAKLAELKAVAGTSVASFARDLQLGSTGADVKALQVYLNGHGFSIASKGAGSPGNETTRFGSATKAALAKFQKSVGISPASGNFGPKTRGYIAANP